MMNKKPVAETRVLQSFNVFNRKESNMNMILVYEVCRRIKNGNQLNVKLMFKLWKLSII